MENPAALDSSKKILLADFKARAGLLSPFAAVHHPTAANPASRSGGNSLRSAAEICVGYGSPNSTAVGTPGVWGAAFSTSDFPSLIAAGLKSVSDVSLIPHVHHRLFTSMRTLPNFMPHQFPMVGFDALLGLLSESGEGASSCLVADSPGLSAKIDSYACLLRFSRALFLADDIGRIAGAAAFIAGAAGHLEAKAVYTKLESNPTMADNEAMFHVNHGNLIESAAFSAAALGLAIGKLRDMPTPAGAKANLDVKYLLVSSADEYAARKAVSDAALPIVVIASAWISEARWYVLADPVAAPVIALLHLDGTDGKPMFSRGNDRDHPHFDGVVISAVFDFGVVPVGRTGVVCSRAS